MKLNENNTVLVPTAICAILAAVALYFWEPAKVSDITNQFFASLF